MDAELEDWPVATDEHDHLKVKIAACPTCGGWITVAAFPWCEGDKESRKEFNAHLKAGDTIDVMTLGESKKLAYCPQDHLAAA